jgi:carbon-monoxide dehydrogenase large subunit
VAGQHHGSFMFGLGMALGEEYKYDDEGHLLNASFGSYAMPRSTDVPEITKLFEIPAPSLTIPGGHKGAGESSTGPVPAAVANAIADAIGVRFTQLPITSEKILLALREKQRRQVQSLRFPDDMPGYAGPQGVADWPKPPADDELGLLL